jgi:hypothetical protein
VILCGRGPLSWLNVERPPARQTSDQKGARLMLDALPKTKSLAGDKGYDSDGFSSTPMKKGNKPCNPRKKNRKIQHDYG